MPALNSSVLILGLPSLPAMQIGVDSLPSWKPLAEKISRGAYDVLCAPFDEMVTPQFEHLAQQLKDRNPSLQMVLLSQPNNSIEDLQKIFRKYPIFRISNISALTTLERDIVHCLEEAQMAKQERELESLVQEQNEKLTLLYQDLEERVEKRQNFLLEARRKTYVANARWESLKEAMIAIYQSASTGEMEQNLLRALEPTLHLSSLRILFAPQDQFFSQQKRQASPYFVFQAPLFRSQDRVGSLVFLRETSQPFLREETDFLLRIAEAVSLALDRQGKLEQSETLKEQWQVTFNAVSDPVSLINQKYELVQTNSAFLKKAGLSSDQATGQKCYQVLFQRESPCPQCQLGKNFRLDVGKSKSIYDVYSQQVPVEPLQTTVFVNLYHDVTEQIRMERKILESARLAEIGTIGSSIAHELNNPLGGILSFVQLIKMDLKKEDALYEDILAMEEGVRRCKEIIENLLGFTRDPMADQEKDLDLREVIERAIKIVELQTKSRGIELKVILPSEPCSFRGHLNLLSQAVRNLLQSSIDALIAKTDNTKGFHPSIELRLENKNQEYLFTLLDNSLGSESTSTLSLSVAGQIIHDYGGQLEFGAQSKPFKITKFSLPR
ncbi:MAG: histidine kinase [Bdellovibrio sp. CG10_big_fil_rev_8_21_14_0_10_47_8]|nr:MAG: histidine kinase [Bdellovibrio sp. CG10_big_fil_rev_8_21_14_0_10_47_8]